MIQQKYKIGEASQITVAVLDMDKLQGYMHTAPEAISYETLQDQIVYRDLCFVIDKDKTWDALLTPIKQLDTINNIEIFDLYAGNKLPEGKKSLAFTFSIKGDGTMTTEQINTILQKVIQTAEAHGAQLRN